MFFLWGFTCKWKSSRVATWFHCHSLWLLCWVSAISTNQKNYTPSWTHLIDRKNHKNPRKSMKIHENPQKPTKIHENPPKPTKNPRKSMKIHEHPPWLRHFQLDLNGSLPFAPPPAARERSMALMVKRSPVQCNRKPSSSTWNRVGGAMICMGKSIWANWCPAKTFQNNPVKRNDWKMVTDGFRF